jgi:small subunit ribosomal protein S9
MTTPAFYSGTGRRKTAIARVRLLPGEGEIVVNGRRSTSTSATRERDPTSDAVPRHRTEGHFNAMIKVEGGGVTGQAGAIRHGIARRCSRSTRTPTACRSARPASSPATRG